MKEELNIEKANAARFEMDKMTFERQVNLNYLILFLPGVGSSTKVLFILKPMNIIHFWS